MEALQLPPESLSLRAQQTRRYDTSDEKALLSAGAAVLQDLGFTIEESEASLGVIVASKDRDAMDAGQIFGKIVIGVLTGADSPIDTHQKIRAALVSRPISPDQIHFRITFQRTVWNERGVISKSETIQDPLLYQGFFDRLSKAVFLEAHSL